LATNLKRVKRPRKRKKNIPQKKGITYRSRGESSRGRRGESLDLGTKLQRGIVGVVGELSRQMPECAQCAKEIKKGKLGSVTNIGGSVKPRDRPYRRNMLMYKIRVKEAADKRVIFITILIRVGATGG